MSETETKSTGGESNGSLPRLVRLEVSGCNDCPYSDIYSVDCVAQIHCQHPKFGWKEHPKHGGDGVETMWVDFPDFCPLPIVEPNDPTEGSAESAIPNPVKSNE